MQQTVSYCMYLYPALYPVLDLPTLYILFDGFGAVEMHHSHHWQTHSLAAAWLTFSSYNSREDTALCFCIHCSCKQVSKRVELMQQQLW